MKPREKAALQYNEALKAKFAAHPQVKRIARHRQVPKHIYNAKAELHTIHEKSKRKYVQLSKEKMISISIVLYLEMYYMYIILF